MENIANLIPTEEAPSTRAPRYQSKHSEKVKKEASTRRAGAGMMGPRKAPGARAADPKQFMKKQQGGGAGARVKKGEICRSPTCKGRRLPADWKMPTHAQAARHLTATSLPYHRGGSQGPDGFDQGASTASERAPRHGNEDKKRFCQNKRRQGDAGHTPRL